MSVENHQHTEPKSPNNKRRTIVKAALTAPPVIATLTSKPVQAVQGLSNMLSGDASVCRGDDRYGGMSPGFWVTPTPGVSQLGDSHQICWSLTGFEWGTLADNNQPNKWQSYSGGTSYNSVFQGGDSRPLREVLGQDSGTDHWHILTGLLNARYFEAKAMGGTTQYIFSVAQFWDMYHGVLDIPVAYASLRDLIESNHSPYHRIPGDSC